MNITEAIFWSRGGCTFLADGHASVIIEPKKSLLDLEVVVVADDDPDHDTYWQNIRFALAPDPANGRASSLSIEGGTNDPVIVCLARRYWNAVNTPGFTPDTVPVPSREEAIAELADQRAWPKGI
jgi:hypothetical protein